MKRISGHGISIPKLTAILVMLNLLQALALVGMLIIFVVNPEQSLPQWLMAMVALTVSVAGLVSGRVGRFAMADQEQMLEMEALLRSQDQLNRQLRMQRHDFINHTQVVYSLLQMQESQKAQEYLQRVYRDLEKVGDLLKTQSSAVNGLLAAKSVQSQKRGLSLSFAIQTPLKAMPLEDWEFCRILGNLLDNAMDAAEQGENGQIELRLWEDIAGLHFSVTNHGPAIAPRLREAIFRPGFTTKGNGGTGMGLAIVSQILSEHGGSISLSSEEGATCFAGLVPRAPVDDISAP